MSCIRTIILLALSLTLAACQRDSGPDPLQLTGKMFVFNYRLAYATYLVTLNRTQPVPEGSTVTAEFQNPAGGDALTLTRPLFPKQEKVVLESPDVTCIKKQTPYRVAIRVNAPDGTELQRLETTVVSDLDQSVLPAEALVIGPAYEKNPRMFRNGELVPRHFDTSKCPQ